MTLGMMPWPRPVAGTDRAGARVKVSALAPARPTGPPGGRSAMMEIAGEAIGEPRSGGGRVEWRCWKRTSRVCRNVRARSATFTTWATACSSSPPTASVRSIGSCPRAFPTRGAC